MILTAPPKITDADYQKLKKLGTREKMKEKFELALQEKRQVIIEERIKNTGAYYSKKDWEEDYKRQVLEYFINSIVRINVVVL
jgi:hypothetical protein